MTKILEGVRVLELGQVLAGPFAGAILADLGAEVLKIERISSRRKLTYSSTTCGQACHKLWASTALHFVQGTPV